MQIMLNRKPGKSLREKIALMKYVCKNYLHFKPLNEIS
jgi:hypothetical protein